jgi:hypothetical protein
MFPFDFGHLKVDILIVGNVQADKLALHLEYMVT